MKYSFQCPNRTDSTIELISGASGRFNVSVNGKPADVVNKRKNIYNLHFEDGTSSEFQIKPAIFGLSLVGYIDNNKIQITKPLSWYDYILCLIPLVLIFRGGAIGGAIGGACTFINAGIIHNSKSIIRKILLTLLVDICAALAYLIIAGSFFTIFNL